MTNLQLPEEDEIDEVTQRLWNSLPDITSEKVVSQLRTVDTLRLQFATGRATSALVESADKVKGAMDAFTKESADGARKLTHATWALVFATAFLGLATAGLVVVEWLKRS
jgi:hypothetical protein